jgi:hypothetical protein
MNTKNLAIATAVGVFALVGLLVAFPAMAASTGFASPQNSNINKNILNAPGQLPKADLQVGQSFTLTSVAGGYREVGNPAVNGTATGSLTIQVTGTFTGGYAVSVTGGQVNANGSTYTVSGGSGELGLYGIHMVGQGQAGTSVQFLFSAINLGKFGSTDYGVLRVDLSNGSGEFAVRLLVTMSAAA